MVGGRIGVAGDVAVDGNIQAVRRQFFEAGHLESDFVN
jgi:hypothetical protein